MMSMQREQAWKRGWVCFDNQDPHVSCGGYFQSDCNPGCKVGAQPCHYTVPLLCAGNGVCA